MLIYSATKARFAADVRQNVIEARIERAFRQALGHRTSAQEVQSWANSMMYMHNIIDDEAIPHDAGVAIEYRIPQTAKRIDFLLTGADGDDRDTVVIVELKQWTEVEATPKDAIVKTWLGGAHREVTHPSYQAWIYQSLLEDFNEAVSQDAIRLQACAYLHNCQAHDALHDPRYKPYTDRAPVFLRRDAERLTEFIKRHVRRGDRRDLLYRIERGKIRPSKSLADSLARMLQGNEEFRMIDDQKVVYETALHLAQRASAPGGQKQVLLVQGGPGTGKSVVAVNLLVELTRRGSVVHYVTKNAAPRAVYESKLAGTLKKTRINNLFKSSGSYHAIEPDSLDALVVDEAHRLNAKSGMYQNQGENQIKEVIRAARLSVFFLDEAQRVTWKDIGGRDEILRHARDAGASVKQLQLESQFRCNGSDGYLAWLDHTLQIRATANEEFGDVDFDFRVCDSPAELASLIEERNRETGRARLVAGYCWPWASKKKSGATDIGFPEYGFAKQWNLSEDGSLWILKADSIDQVGCIHTCQGLELDYVGVIVGPDLVVREGVVETHPEARAKQDSSLKGYKTELKRDRAAAQRQAAAIIKNTYRTLMTRGQKGCYLWSTDPETNLWFKQAFAGATADAEQPSYGRLPACLERTPPSAIKTSSHAAPASQKSFFPTRVRYPGLALPILTPAAARVSGNAAPIFDVVALAGAFSAEQEADESGAGDWVELPPEFRVTEGMFVLRVEGESMNRRIPNGSWCLFKRVGAGTREGKIVLAQHRELTDAEHGGHYTVKQYHRVPPAERGGKRGPARIELRPLSTDPTHQPLIFDAENTDSLTILAELVAVLGD